jgi:hypothetical protein
MTTRDIRWHGRRIFTIIVLAEMLVTANYAKSWLWLIVGVISQAAILAGYIALTLHFDRVEERIDAIRERVHQTHGPQQNS